MKALRYIRWNMRMPMPPGRRVMVSANLTAHLISSLLLALVMFLARPQEGTGDGVWTSHVSGTTVDLNGVAGSSLINVFAVGNGGTICHYDGTNWNSQVSGTTAHLYDVWVAPDGSNVFVAGNGRVLRYNGSSWSSQTLSNGYYYGVWGTSASDVFVGGYKYVNSSYQIPMIVHYNGTTWSYMEMPHYNGSANAFPYRIMDLWGTASNDVYASGSQGMVIHYDGDEWDYVCGLNSLGDEILYPGDIYNGIWGAGGKVFAAGWYGQDTWPYAACVAYDDSWIWEPRHWIVTNYTTLNEVWGQNEANLMAVGYHYGGSCQGEVLRYNGSSWTMDMSYPNASNTPPMWLGVWGMGGDYFVVGADGAIMRYESPLGILSTTPSAGATDVSTNAVIQVTFTREVDALTVTSSTFHVSGVAGAIAYDAPSRTATLTPSPRLAVMNTYTATVTTGVQTPGGDSMEENCTWTFTTETGPDIYPPYVVSNYPPAGATNVPRNVVVTATFNEDMDPSKFNALTFKLNNLHITGTVDYDEETRTASFTPNGWLDYSKYCYAQLTTGLCDTNGNYMTSNYGWEFTTQPPPDTTPPTVTNTLPADEAVDVSATNVIQVYFSENISEASRTNASCISMPGMNGALTWPVNSRAVFTPASNMTYNASYIVHVSANIRDVAGNAMSAPYSFSFTVQDVPDTNPPSVVSFQPTNGTDWVTVDSSVAVTFDEDMDTNTLLAASFFIQGVTGTVGYNKESKTAIFTPVANLDFAQTYTVQVTTNVSDCGGNGIRSNLFWSFTTADHLDDTPPEVIDFTPNDGATGVASTTAVSVVFSEDMDGVSVGGSFYLRGRPGSVLYNSATRRAVCAPATAFDPGGTYTAVVAFARDLSGIAMTGEVEWTFTMAAVPDTNTPVSTATPPGGAYAAETNIALAATDATYDSASLLIYYTTNGVDPTLASPTYSAPIALITNLTIKFFAVDPEGNQEAVNTATYLLDMIPPVSSCSPTGGVTMHEASVLVTLDAEDEGGSGVSNIYYAVNPLDSEWWAAYDLYEGPFTIQQSDNNAERLYFYAVDGAGNREAAQYTWFDLVDHGDWQAEPSGTTVDLWDIDGASASDIYAVGDGGTIMHFNGSAWALESPGAAVNLYGVHVSAGGVYVAGDEGTVLSGVSGSWTVHATGAPYAMRDVWAAADGTVFAVGDGAQVYRYFGGEWEKMDTHGSWLSDIYGVWGFSTTDVYACDKFGIIAHYDGETWTMVGQPGYTESGGWPLYDIWGTSGGDMFAVGRPDA
ncbi:MAG: hypothetical protein EOM20_15010, partial [Spartobacteria bacterium]|nr:hypothetical protein [Spartobacteria bacterium]